MCGNNRDPSARLPALRDGERDYGGLVAIGPSLRSSQSHEEGEHGPSKVVLATSLQALVPIVLLPDLRQTI